MNGQPSVPLLEALPLPSSTEPSWLSTRRQAAAEALRAHGLPTRKDEAWRFTPLDAIVDASFARATLEQPSPAALGTDPSRALQIVDGRPELEGFAIPEGIELRSLRDLLREDPARLEPLLGGLSSGTHFAGLNAALFEDGLLMRISAQASSLAPLRIEHRCAPRSERRVSYPRMLILVEEGAEASLVETFLGPEGPAGSDASGSLRASVTEIFLAAGSRLEHVRLSLNPSLEIAELSVQQARSSHYASRSFALGGALDRLDLRVHLEGEGAECLLEGAYHASAHERVDNHLRVEHRAPHCTSHQRYRGVLDGNGLAVFDGLSIVAPNAQRSEAHQENRNLLLSDEARVHTKPHLEIEADDVSCSHGATVGALDEEPLFYLRARGIGAREARDILIYAFLRSIVDRVQDEPTREQLAEAFLGRLPHGEVIGDLR
ncbi:MAG: Fe-S cluster assembly protein SufD [Myxococcales bacterium]|nr:Fe-S cluster assembly protein SufD [Myxococcales bacterium]